MALVNALCRDPYYISQLSGRLLTGILQRYHESILVIFVRAKGWNGVPVDRAGLGCTDKWEMCAALYSSNGITQSKDFYTR